MTDWPRFPNAPITEALLDIRVAFRAISHPAYRGIIALGPAAVPMILRELADRPGHWFAALSEITGEDPIPQDAYGDVDAMTRAWLQWAKENQIAW